MTFRDWKSEILIQELEVQPLNLVSGAFLHTFSLLKVWFLQHYVLLWRLSPGGGDGAMAVMECERGELGVMIETEGAVMEPWTGSGDGGLGREGQMERKWRGWVSEAAELMRGPLTSSNGCPSSPVQVPTGSQEWSIQAQWSSAKGWGERSDNLRHAQPVRARPR